MSNFIFLSIMLISVQSLIQRSHYRNKVWKKTFAVSTRLHATDKKRIVFLGTPSIAAKSLEILFDESSVARLDWSCQSNYYFI